MSTLLLTLELTVGAWILIPVTGVSCVCVAAIKLNAQTKAQTNAMKVSYHHVKFIFS